jgi:hypothetical protein
MEWNLGLIPLTQQFLIFVSYHVSFDLMEI